MLFWVSVRLKKEKLIWSHSRFAPGCVTAHCCYRLNRMKSENKTHRQTRISTDDLCTYGTCSEHIVAIQQEKLRQFVRHPVGQRGLGVKHRQQHISTPAVCPPLCPSCTLNWTLLLGTSH